MREQDAGSEPSELSHAETLEVPLTLQPRFLTPHLNFSHIVFIDQFRRVNSPEKLSYYYKLKH